LHVTKADGVVVSASRPTRSVTVAKTVSELPVASPHTLPPTRVANNAWANPIAAQVISGLNRYRAEKKFPPVF